MAWEENKDHHNIIATYLEGCLLTTRIVGVAFALLLAFVTLGAPTPAAASHLRTGAYARTTTALNLRSGPSTSYRYYYTMRSGSSVWVIRYARNGYYYVKHNGNYGYAYGSYLSQGSTSTYSGSYSKGQAIANTGKSYVGYRYAYYGNTPSEGFSCVGFTQWVYRQHGIYIPERLGGQASMGVWVSRSNLRPGDLVFYQNTVWSGLSHVGIYVGNNYMVHSGSPRTGVNVAYMGYSYWTSRWYGARRLV